MRDFDVLTSRRPASLEFRCDHERGIREWLTRRCIGKISNEVDSGMLHGCGIHHSYGGFMGSLRINLFRRRLTSVCIPLPKFSKYL